MIRYPKTLLIFSSSLLILIYFLLALEIAILAQQLYSTQHIQAKLIVNLNLHNLQHFLGCSCPNCIKILP